METQLMLRIRGPQNSRHFVRPKNCTVDARPTLEVALQIHPYIRQRTFNLIFVVSSQESEEEWRCSNDGVKSLCLRRKHLPEKATEQSAGLFP